MRNSRREKVLIVGGEDVHARIPLIEKLREKWDFAVVGSDVRGKLKFNPHGIPYYYYALSRRVNLIKDIVSLFQLVLILFKVRPAIVHTFDTKPNVLARIMARICGIKVVIGTITGLGVLYTEEYKGNSIKQVYQSLQRIASHASSATIFQNNDDCIAFTKLGIVPREKACVILGSGVDTNYFDPQKVDEQAKRKFLREHNIAKGTIVVTLITRLIKSKGVLEFAEVSRNIRARRQRVKFLLVGPYDRESGDCINQRELGFVESNVDYIGLQKDIRTILSCTDIFVLPTSYREGIPRVLLEAAAMGKPLIAVDSPGCNEIVKHGENGILISSRNTEELELEVEKLICDERLRREYGKISRERSKLKFDLDIIAAQIAEVYDKYTSSDR